MGLPNMRPMVAMTSGGSFDSLMNHFKTANPIVDTTLPICVTATLEHAAHEVQASQSAIELFYVALEALFQSIPVPTIHQISLLSAL